VQSFFQRKTIIITFSESMLGVQHAMRVRHIVRLALQYSITLFHKQHGFRNKKNLYILFHFISFNIFHIFCKYCSELLRCFLQLDKQEGLIT
jgi:hypothetical protein